MLTLAGGTMCEDMKGICGEHSKILHGLAPLPCQHEVAAGSGHATVSTLPHEDMTGLERFSELRRITPVRKR